MEKLKNAIDEMEYHEIKFLQKELECGAKKIKEIVNKKLQAIEDAEGHVCMTCGDVISKNKNSFTLIFGPPEDRKKANFCAHDCLHYFLTNLNKVKNEKKEMIE